MTLRERFVAWVPSRKRDLPGELGERVVVVPQGPDLLLVAVFLRNAAARDRRTILVMFSGVAALRAMTVALMLFVCRTSYWTAFRTLSDDGPALSLVLAGAILVAADFLTNRGDHGLFDARRHATS